MLQRHGKRSLACLSAALAAAAAQGVATPQSELMESQRALMGDLNGDGVVDVGDLQVLLSNFGATGAGPLDGDLNGDGVVDREDVRRLLSMFGDTVDDADVVAALSDAGLLGDVDPQPQPPQSPWGTHHPIISNQQHSQAFSQSHPNHDNTFSTGWPGVHNAERSEYWPPNHVSSLSTNWPDGHNAGVSKMWPPNHYEGVSEFDPKSPWTWDPDDHTIGVSITWPPAHHFQASKQGTPSHFPGISAQWFDEDENPLPNAPSWPPGHLMAISNNWGTHNAQLSHTWPPNHFKIITASWDHNNHDGEISKTWPPNHHSQAHSATVGVHSQRQSNHVVVVDQLDDIAFTQK